MRKKFYLLLLAACTSTITFAQVQKVQGVPRKAAKSVTAEPSDTVSPNIDFDQIKYWVGGWGRNKNQAALVVKWDDKKGNNTNLVWGYTWDKNAKATGEKMLKDVAKSDPRFYMLVKDDTQYGAAIGGLGYDLNGNGNISLVKEGKSYQLTDGVYSTSAYDFDSWNSNDTEDHWRAGWYNGYWSYWIASGSSSKYEYSPVGASSRILTDKSVDGWSFMSDMSNWYSNDMHGKLEYVLEPVATGAVEKSATTPNAHSFMVNSLEELRYAIENKAADGDTIFFRPGLKGTVVENDNPEYGYEINKSVVIEGNGIILGPGNGFASYATNKTVTFKNMVFSRLTDVPLFFDGCNLNVENCIFDSCHAVSPGNFLAGAIFLTNTNNRGKNLKSTIKGCVFSNNYCEASTPGVISVLSHGSGLVNIASCTFIGNEAKNGGDIFDSGQMSIAFANNVFAGNKNTATDGKTIFVSPKNGKANLKSLGYNVITGSITEAYKDSLAPSDTINETIDNVVALQEGYYKVVKDGPAYNRLPANTTFDSFSLPAKDISGLTISYEKPSHSGSCQLVYETAGEDVDYTKGTFIVNEDWYGHQNSTLNFLTEDGEWIYRVIQKENPGVELGCTNQYGAIYGDKFYLIAKQDKDPGASIQGARITIADAKTLKVEKQIPVIAADDEGASIADGRGFLGVDEHKGYVGTNNGIYILDLDKQEITGKIKGAGNNGGSAYEQLYSGQIGNMVRVNDRVFAVHQSKGLYVIDPATDMIVDSIPANDAKWGFGSVVLSKDGNLWLSIAAKNGAGGAQNRLLKVDPATLDTTYINCPDGIYGPANSWYAWTPDCFSASKQHNVLYWNGGTSSWFSNTTIYKYDIDKNEFSTYLDFNTDPDKWLIYGCSFRVSPVTDEAYVSLYKNFGSTDYVLRRYDNTGKQLAEYPMIANYWFPSLPVFPDNEAPVVGSLDAQTISGKDSVVVSLANLATDADNMDAAIVKSVKSISDESVVSAKMSNGNLVITPLKDGSATIVIGINSNGKLAETSLQVSVDNFNSINNTYTNAAATVDAYTLDGRRVNTATKGLRIIRKADGTVQKVVVK